MQASTLAPTKIKEGDVSTQPSREKQQQGHLRMLRTGAQIAQARI